MTELQRRDSVVRAAPERGPMPGPAPERGLLGLFADEEAAAHAIRALREAGLNGITGFSPVPPHEMLEELDAGTAPSPVRRFTLIGGIIGVCCGFAIGAYTAVAYGATPLVVAGRPLVAWPPYVIIMFELMVLLGGLATFVGVLVNGRLPRAGARLEYASEFTGDRFGVFVAADDPARARDVLQRNHAVEIREVHP
ncbi:MAG: DUF3341 domain-containing protein [Gemmatimonadota bacterium]